MVKVKFCGLRRPEDIEAVNELGIDYAGFVFAKKSKRYVDPGTALELKKKLSPGITTVGVFVDEAPEDVARLIKDGVIDIAQLHGSEDDAYIARLRGLIEPFDENVNPDSDNKSTNKDDRCKYDGMISEFNESERMRGKEIKAYNTLSEETQIKIIKAYKIDTDEDVRKANVSTADMILLDSGSGSGKEFDWSLLKEMKRPYFLAGGLDPTNAADAIEKLSPYALDVSSGIETDGFKDKEKMTRFMERIGRR